VPKFTHTVKKTKKLGSRQCIGEEILCTTCHGRYHVQKCSTQKKIKNPKNNILSSPTGFSHHKHTVEWRERRHIKQGGEALKING
jgi:hypothetical protein